MYSLIYGFGTIFNLLIKKVVTEEEFEEIAANTKLAKLKRGIKSTIQQLKGQNKQTYKHKLSNN